MLPRTRQLLLPRLADVDGAPLQLHRPVRGRPAARDGDRSVALEVRARSRAGARRLASRRRSRAPRGGRRSRRPEARSAPAQPWPESTREAARPLAARPGSPRGRPGEKIRGVRRYRWEWLLRRTPEELWPLVSDTNRFNRDAGVPAVERLGPRRLRLRRYGVPI